MLRKQNLHESHRRHRASPDIDNDSIATAHAPGCRCRDYDSLVTALLLLRDTGIFGRFLPSRIFRRQQAGFATEHLKNDIRECCYLSKRTRPDTTMREPLFRRTYQREKTVPVPQTFYFMYPAARASSRFFSCWWDGRSCTVCNVETKQTCVLAQSCQ
jgi:hypothetical protein